MDINKTTFDLYKTNSKKILEIINFYKEKLCN